MEIKTVTDLKKLFANPAQNVVVEMHYAGGQCVSRIVTRTTKQDKK